MYFFAPIIFTIQIFAQSQENRIALVIGNSSYYENHAQLKNPKNDANAMEMALQNVGFDVEKIIDGSKEQIENAIRRYTKKLKDCDLNVFYYAGHGFQIDGQNYIVPIDARIEDKADGTATLETFMNYDNNETAWKLGRLLDLQIKSANKLLKWQKFVYDEKNLKEKWNCLEDRSSWPSGTSTSWSPSRPDAPQPGSAAPPP